MVNSGQVRVRDESKDITRRPFHFFTFENKDEPFKKFIRVETEEEQEKGGEEKKRKKSPGN